MFEDLEPVTARVRDTIVRQFEEDLRPDKINLHTGLYKNENGECVILPCVKKAEEMLLATETSKSYLDMGGSPEFASAIESLIFEAPSDRIATIQTPGGTAALRVAADFLKSQFPKAKAWVSEQTWTNHLGVVDAAGFEIRIYPYADPEKRELQFDAMLKALSEVPAGDVVLFQSCCHNPTGLDPTLEQWHKIADVALKRKFLPIQDIAFFGFGDGLREDFRGLNTFVMPGLEFMVTTSLSKAFSLYNERAGALTVVADKARTVHSHLRRTVRVNYSNPPAHGGAIVSTILNDPELRAEWEAENAQMRERVRRMRTLLAEKLNRPHILREKGIFTRLDLTPVQVQELREKHAIYMPNSSHVNVVAMTEKELDRLCAAVRGSSPSKDS